MAGAADASKKVLFFSKSGAFEHPMIAVKNRHPSKPRVIRSELAIRFQGQEACLAISAWRLDGLNFIVRCWQNNFWVGQHLSNRG